ncbi:MAG TPA: DUF4271 domain-containing protein [Arachidicoccus sp.]|nr:DUF4271 domain-containing protein [Arachidicoccus sp.]
MKQILTLLILIGSWSFALGQRTDSLTRKDSNNPATDKQRPVAGQKPPAKAPATISRKDTNAAKKSIPTRRADSVKKSVTTPTAKSAASNKADASSTGSNPVVPTTAATTTAANTAVRSPDSVDRAADSLAALLAAQERALRENMASEALRNTANKFEAALYFPDFLLRNSTVRHSEGTILLHFSDNKDSLFYSFLGLALLLGLIKIIFPRYFNQVFWFFLHPSDRKKNVTEQLSGQNVLPSLLLNLFFALTGGLFLAQIIKPNWPGASFWRNWLLFTLMLMAVYLIKFLVIKLSGWIFNSPAAAALYNQVVFSINKVIGLILLPAALLIAFGSQHTLALTFSYTMVIIGILLIYRYIASFLLIKGKLKVTAFHFILYLCAVEIIPLLLVYRVLFTNIGQLI